MNDSNTPPEAAWHAMADEEALELIGSTPDGLSVDETQMRQSRYGRNVIPRQSKASLMEILWGQINNPLIWVLLGSGVLAVGLGKITDGAVVLGVVVIHHRLRARVSRSAGHRSPCPDGSRTRHSRPSRKTSHR